MRPENDCSDGEFATAVAASAFAIHSREEYMRHLRIGYGNHMNTELKADTWEKAQMEKIKKRYDKIFSDALAWENERKARAKLELEKKKNELVHRRDRYLQRYRVQVAKIDHIAQGAKVQVEDRRKFEETAVKERAKKLKSAGKAPVNCFYF